MAISQARSKRSATGARYVDYRKKKQHETGRLPTLTKLGEGKRKVLRTIGNNRKEKLLSEQFVNVADPKTKKVEKLKIDSVVENPANRNFVRRNIITKGTVVETKKGRARITSRPGQGAVINAVMI